MFAAASVLGACLRVCGEFPPLLFLALPFLSPRYKWWRFTCLPRSLSPDSTLFFSFFILKNKWFLEFVAPLAWREWASLSGVTLILSYTLIWIFPVYKYHFKDSPSLRVLYKRIPEPVAENFLHWMLLWWLESQQGPFQGGRLDLVIENSVSCCYVRGTKWVFFFFFHFFLSSFFKPDNFLQLTWDLILTSWSFTCFDIFEIKTSARWSLSRVGSDVTQALPKQPLVLPVCFLLKEGLPDGFSAESRMGVESERLSSCLALTLTTAVQRKPWPSLPQFPYV